MLLLSILCFDFQVSRAFTSHPKSLPIIIQILKSNNETRQIFFKKVNH
jgi:hypothetical protein